MPLNDELLEILLLPGEQDAGAPAGEWELDRLNEAIAAGRVRHADQSAVEQTLEEGLITEDGTVIYKVDSGIPIMLEEKGIPADQLG